MDGFPMLSAIVFTPALGALLEGLGAAGLLALGGRHGTALLRPVVAVLEVGVLQ